MTQLIMFERRADAHLFTDLLMRLENLCMLEATAIFASDAKVLLRVADLTMLGYTTREAEAALFALARLGLIEPLECRDDAEFAVSADVRRQALLSCFDAALREPLFRQAVTLETLAREQLSHLY